MPIFFASLLVTSRPHRAEVLSYQTVDITGTTSIDSDQTIAAHTPAVYYTPQDALPDLVTIEENYKNPASRIAV